jgi:glutathione peroxidase
LLAAAAACGVQQLRGVFLIDATVHTESVYDLTVQDLSGRAAPLAAYSGHVSLIVNVASECTLAAQYPGIEALFQRYHDRGFVVLAFPSNDFGGQEPGSAGDIRRACDLRGVTFPVFARTRVRAGARRSPVYDRLASTGHQPRWNFAKYLVGRDGRPRAFFGSLVHPDAPRLRAAIEAALDEPMPR